MWIVYVIRCDVASAFGGFTGETPVPLSALVWFSNDPEPVEGRGLRPTSGTHHFPRPHSGPYNL